MTTPRPHLSMLGRHLHRSVLQVCLPVDDLRALLGDRPSLRHRPDAEVRDAAADLVGCAHADADRLHDALDRLHAAALARFAGVRDARALAALWQDAVRGQDLAGAYWALLTHPLADRALRHLAFGDVEMLAHEAPTDAPLADLLGRRSVAPRRLAEPGPPQEHVDLMLQAALSAPDHGRLHPWRVIEFRDGSRDALANLFEQEKGRRDPLAGAADLRRAREHATRAPCLLAFVVALRQRKRVPVREQWLAAGAALGNLLNAAHALGYGAMVLSGDRCFDKALCRQLGLTEGEFLAGFVSVGSIVEAAPETARALPQTVWSCWSPSSGARRGARPASLMPDFDDENIA